MIKCVRKLDFDKIQNDKQCKLFIEFNNGIYIACDNSSNNMWVEEFDDLESAVSWLKGEFEINE